MLPIRVLKMKETARIVTLFGLLFALSLTCYSKPKDVLGWRGARWGMSDKDIVKVFGSRAEKLRQLELYGSGHLGYIIPGIKLKGQTFTALFQMAGGRTAGAVDTLSEVHVRLDQTESRVPRDDVFNSLGSLLTQQYGAPDSRKDERPSETPIRFLHLSRTWRFPTTTVQLLCAWDRYSSKITIRYFPTDGKAEW